MNDPTTRIDARGMEAVDERQFAKSLLTIGGVADRAMVARTLRLVRERKMEIAERRQRARKGIGVAILGFSLLSLILTPVFWSVFHLQFDDGWQGFSGVDMQSMTMLGWIFPVTIFALVLAGLGLRSRRGARRTDHRTRARFDSLVR